MAATRDLADLRTEIRQRCDQESSTFIADAELDTWIAQSVAALFDVVLDYAGPDAFLTEQSLSVVSGTADYSLDAAAYRVQGVDVLFDGRWRELPRASFSERNRWQDGGWSGPWDTRWMLAGRTAAGLQRIRFVPTPSAAYSARVWYLPTPAALVAGSVVLVSFNGWDEWVIADVAAKIVEKEEGDSRPWLARKAEAQARIAGACKALSSGQSVQMRDALRDEWSEDHEPLWRS